MNTNRLFIGDIYVCLYAGFIGHLNGPIETRRLLKKNALLIKCGEDRYIDIDDIENMRDFCKAKRNKLFITTTPTHRFQYFIDKQTLKEADLFNMEGNVKLKEIKLTYKNEFRN